MAAQPIITFSRNVFLPLTTVCRNRCDYCGFRTPVHGGCVLQSHLVIETLKKGAQLGCTEALFTFGERPEEEPGFSEIIGAIGYLTILDYCREMCKKSLELGLLPHTNAGVLSYDDLEYLKPFNASMGLMLETTATLPAHRNSPGKNPDVRIETIENAGKLKIPFTTGILVGIGETNADREASLTVIRDLHRRYGHIQEVIIQNFCPKDGTPMGRATPPTSTEMCATITLAREILPPEVAVQIPPNLLDASSLIRCGVNDLGGVSPLTHDYINPEYPWPEIADLRKVVGAAELRERLCIYPRFIKMRWYSRGIEALIRQLEQKIVERPV